MSKQIISSQHRTGHASYTTYVTGFILSLILTFVSFGLVITESISGGTLVGLLVGFALLQLLVQLRFFIHLNDDSGPKWSWVVFIFMTVVVAIVVFGTLWIMHNLNYNMMPQDMEHRMYEQNNSGGF